MSVSTAVPEANSALTVTAVAPASSARAVCCPASELTSTAKSTAAGAMSSSVMVTAAEAVRPNKVPVNRTRSAEVSSTTSSTGVRVTDPDPLTAPAATATVKPGMVTKSSPAFAPSPAAVKATAVWSVNSEVRAPGKDTARAMEEAPASSSTAAGLAVTVNRASSSVMVRVAGLTE